MYKHADGQNPIDIEGAGATLSELKKDRFLRIGVGAGSVDLLDFPAFRKLAAAVRENAPQSDPDPDYSPVAQSPYAPEDPAARGRFLLNLIDQIESRDEEREREKQAASENREHPVLVDPYNARVNRAEETRPGDVDEFPEAESVSKYYFTRDNVFFDDDVKEDLSDDAFFDDDL
ncbi:MAG: hypothetical protein FWE86_04980 [Oscillospiraceae bacterium]|nr:hypothetical protein [Oscillospiraceae bacterium]